MNTAIDDCITEIEGASGMIYQKLLEGRIPTDEKDRSYFSMFLACMYHRTNTMRRITTELYGRMLQVQCYAVACNDRSFNVAVSKYEQDEGISLNHEQREKLRKSMLDPSGYIFEVPKERSLIAMANIEETAGILFKMKWSVGKAQEHFFITSDNPLIYRVRTDSIHPIYGDSGFLNKTVQVTMPLSPEHLLILNWQREATGIIPVSKTSVYEENEARAAHSEQLLYSHLDHKDILELAKRHKDSRPDMTMSGFGPKNYAPIKVSRKSRRT